MYWVDLFVHTMYHMHGTVSHGVQIHTLTVLSHTMYEFHGVPQHMVCTYRYT